MVKVKDVTNSCFSRKKRLERIEVLARDAFGSGFLVNRVGGCGIDIIHEGSGGKIACVEIESYAGSMTLLNSHFEEKAGYFAKEWEYRCLASPYGRETLLNYLGIKQFVLRKDYSGEKEFFQHLANVKRIVEAHS